MEISLFIYCRKLKCQYFMSYETMGIAYRIQRNCFLLSRKQHLIIHSVIQEILPESLQGTSKFFKRNDWILFSTFSLQYTIHQPSNLRVPSYYLPCRTHLRPHPVDIFFPPGYLHTSSILSSILIAEQPHRKGLITSYPEALK